MEMRLTGRRHGHRATGFRWTVAVAAMTLLLFTLVGSGVWAAGGGEHGADEPKGWGATDTYRVMNFSVLAIALFFLLRKPVAQALDSRIRGIKDQLDELEAKKRAAEEELAQYTQRLARLDEESQRIVDEYIQQGKDARARIIQEAESAAEKLEEQARRNIDNEFEQARKHLQEDVLEKALEKAEQIIRDRITEDDQERLVDEYLKKVVA
jgi:F-type H+-transporting ATPase subunit b